MNQPSYSELKHLIKEKAKAPRLEKREEIIKEYIDNTLPDGKKYMCRYFIKGKCLFSSDQCHFSHGPPDIVFDKPDLEAYLEKIKMARNKSQKGGNDYKKILEELTESRVTSIEQPSLGLETTYKNLHSYQPKMIQTGDIKECYTQLEIDTSPKLRELMVRLFNRSIQQKLIYYFIGQYNAKFLPKEFVELCFFKVGWTANFKNLINSRCCHDKTHPIYGTIVIKTPWGTAFDELIEDSLIKIIKMNNLFEKRPIRTALISELYRNDLRPNDIYLPSLHAYVSRKRLQLNDILQQIHCKESFVEKLVHELGVSKDEILSKPLFQSDREKSPQQIEEIINSYRSQNLKDSKSQLCRFFMRGLCIFNKDDCQFAHGVNDILYKKVDISIYDQKFSDYRKDEEYLNWQRSCFEIQKASQPSLNLGFTYKVLFEYQFKLIEEGLMREPYDQDQLDEEDSCRNEVKAYMHTDLVKQFLIFFFKEYDRNYLKRSFINKCFMDIGWTANWDKLIDDEFSYEVKDPNLGSLILLVPPKHEFTKFIENCLIEIIKEKSLLDHLPINPGTISKYFYKDLVTNDPLMPTLNIYMKSNKITIENLLQSIQKSISFVENLAIACNIDKNELGKLTIFDSTQSKLDILLQKSKKILLSLLQKSHVGMILFSRFEEAVQKRCSKEVMQFQNNSASLRKILEGTALASGVFIIGLLSERYLFSINKFTCFDYESIQKSYLIKLNMKCRRKENLLTDSSIKYPPPFVDDDSKEAKEDIKLASHINFKKIKLVDNKEALEEAKILIGKAEIIAVDLEGALCKGGWIELIQIGCGDDILVFDLYQASLTKDLNSLYDMMILYLKEMLENPRLCKVFHDCRKDSQALHIFLQTCLVNVFDISAIYMFIKHLELYLNFNDVFPFLSEKQLEEQDDRTFRENYNKGSDLFGYIDNIKGPGLNEVLKIYGASHGTNDLKGVMKKKFEEMPRGYFLKRPIDKDYLVYAAKDVEDLVEVKNGIEARLWSSLQQFNGVVNIESIELLCKKISKTYAIFGCTHQ